MKAQVIALIVGIAVLVGGISVAYAQTASPTASPTPSPTPTTPSGAPNTGYGSMAR